MTRRWFRNPDPYWPLCKCGHAASTHGLTGRTADNETCSRGGQYRCRAKACRGCNGYDNVKALEEG